MPPTLRLGGAYVLAAYRHLGVTRFEHHRDPGRVRRGGCERGLILGFGLWRGLMLDRLPVLGQPAPHALGQRNRIRSGGSAGACVQSGDLRDRGFDGERNGPRGRNRRPVSEERCCGMAGASRGVIPEGCATGRRARQDTEHDHGATAGRASIGPMRRDGILDLFGGRFLRWRVEQLATERKLGGALAVREEAVVADAMEAVRQGVQQEAPDELIGGKRHELGLAVMAIILPAEGDLGIGQADQAGVGDGDAVCVSAEIGEHLSRSIVRMIARNAASLPSCGSRSGAHMLRPPAARPSVRARRSGCRRVYRRIRSNQNPATIAAGGGVIAAAIRSAIAQTSSPILSDFGSSAGQAEYHASNASCSAPSTTTMSAGLVPKAKGSGADTGEGRGTLVGPEQGEDARAGKGNHLAHAPPPLANSRSTTARTCRTESTSPWPAPASRPLSSARRRNFTAAPIMVSGAVRAIHVSSAIARSPISSWSPSSPAARRSACFFRSAAISCSAAINPASVGANGGRAFHSCSRRS